MILSKLFSTASLYFLPKAASSLFKFSLLNIISAFSFQGLRYLALLVLFKKSLNNKFIDLSLKDPEGRKLRSYVIEIKPFKKGVIRNVDLIINNKIKLNDYQIIEKKQNCYFLKKND